MNKLIETAKEIDRILKSGIEIHPNSPIHEKLQQALNIPLVSGLACKCGNKTFTHRHSNWIECTTCNKIQILQA